MDRRRYLSAAGMAFATLAGCLGPDSEPAVDPTGAERVETVTDSLSHPWAIAVLPDDFRFVVTERDLGRLSLVDREDGSTTQLSGIPDVEAAGQGGLLDVAVHPEFPTEPWLYLTYSAANDDGETTTHLARGRLDRDEQALVDVAVLYQAAPFLDRSNHYGSRLTFGPDGRLYMTVGDRQFKDFGPDHVSQDLTNDLGTALRFEPDGSIPADNPFVDDPDARDAIYSYGLRNSQGLTVHPETGELWVSDHGERDGDELLILEEGGNHGWPIAHYGCRYGTSTQVGDRADEREDVVDPVYYWECGSGGFPPAGMTFYEGDHDEWAGDLFVGNLAGQYLGRFSVDGRDVEEIEPLLDDEDWRVRDVVSPPDSDALFVAVDADSAPILRIEPP